MNEITDELLAAGHHVLNIINIHIKKKVENETTVIKLPLLKVEVKTSANNRELFDMQTLCHCRVLVEMTKKIPSLPQCTRCQDLGHNKNS